MKKKEKKGFLKTKRKRVKNINSCINECFVKKMRLVKNYLKSLALHDLTFLDGLLVGDITQLE